MPDSELTPADRRLLASGHYDGAAPSLIRHLWHDLLTSEQETERFRKLFSAQTQESIDGLLGEIVILQERSEKSEEQAAAMREALEKIAAEDMGRVCTDFMECDHPACADSAYAHIIARDALRALEGAEK